MVFPAAVACRLPLALLLSFRAGFVLPTTDQGCVLGSLDCSAGAQRAAGKKTAGSRSASCFHLLVLLLLRLLQLPSVVFGETGQTGGFIARFLFIILFCP